MRFALQVPLAFVCICIALAGSCLSSTVSQPPKATPVQSYSDDPSITGSAASAALCSLQSILGTESGGHGIGPFTVQPNCLSMTLQPHATTSSVNGQTNPMPGIATIYGSSSTISMPAGQPTTAPSASSSSRNSAAASSSTSTASRQTNAGSAQNKPPAAANWIARQNIAVLLFTTFALLAGVTYFLDELLGMLI